MMALRSDGRGAGVEGTDLTTRTCEALLSIFGLLRLLNETSQCTFPFIKNAIGRNGDIARWYLRRWVGRLRRYLSAIHGIIPEHRPRDAMNRDGM